MVWWWWGAGEGGGGEVSGPFVEVLSELDVLVDADNESVQIGIHFQVSPGSSHAIVCDRPDQALASSLPALVQCSSLWCVFI